MDDEKKNVKIVFILNLCVQKNVDPIRQRA